MTDQFVFTLHLTGHYNSISLTMSSWITWGQNHRMGIITSKHLTQLCPGVEPSVDTKRGLWMLSHTHAHVQIWLLYPLPLNLIFKSKSKSNLSQSCTCLCPENKSFPVIHAMGEKLTWDDFLMKITFFIFNIKNFMWHFSHLFLQQKHCLSISKNWSDGPCLPTSTIFVIYIFAVGQWAGQQESTQEWEEKWGKQVFNYVGRQLMS